MSTLVWLLMNLRARAARHAWILPATAASVRRLHYDRPEAWVYALAFASSIAVGLAVGASA